VRVWISAVGRTRTVARRRRRRRRRRARALRDAVDGAARTARVRARASALDRAMLARVGVGVGARPRGGGSGTGRATRRAATATRGRANGRTRDETRGFGARARARVAVAKTRAREGATRGGTRGDGTRREATRDDDDARTREAGGADSVKGARGEDARDGRLPTISRGTYASLATALVALGFPALLNSVNEPVVSLLETVLVARVGTVFLAALAPASALFGLVEEVCFAFSVVVTTAVSSARAEFEDVDAAVPERVKQTVSMSVMASFIAGLGLAIGLQALYGPICKIMVVPREVEALLRSYTVLRCAGLPMFGAANALEGVFLGSKDALTPMTGWLVAGVITVALQLFFITPQMSANAAVRWAGIALTVGQTFIFFYLWKIAHGRGLFSMRSVFKGAESVGAAIARLYRRLEEEHIASEFRWLVLSATARMTTYVIITSCATNLGVISAAVNKTLLDLYILLGLCAEPVFTVGNVLLPRKRRSLVEVLTYRRALFYVALFMGFTLACLAYILCGSTLLSHDPHVHAVATSMRSLVAVTIGLSTAAYATDGCVIGLGGASFVGAAQMINTSIFVLVFIAFRTIYGAATSLQHLWLALLLFQALRLAEHVWKLRHDERALAFPRTAALA